MQFPSCGGKRALSERQPDWCGKANGKRTALRYMCLAPEKAVNWVNLSVNPEAAIAAGE